MPVQTAIKIRRSSVASKIPLTTDLVLGELALNTYDGVLYFKKSPGGTDSIVAVVTLDGTQTLTNKTLTSPALTTPSTTGLASFTTTTAANAVNITYNPTATTGAALLLTGKDSQGGTGYFDFLKTTNTTSGATNPNKSFRINSTGNIEIINSAYSATIFSLTDAGNLTVPSLTISGTLSVSNGVGSSGQILQSTGTGLQWVTSSAGSSGTVTSVSVASANGFAGTVATNTTTPAITISTSITGVLYGNGTAISAASSANILSTFGSQTANTFIAAPNGSAGTPTFRSIVAADIPTLNQNTTGSAGSVTGALTISSPLSGTSYNGSSAVTIALAASYGDTQNPYASKTANYVLAAPNGSAGAPTFRALVSADIPTLNQNTTGYAAGLAGGAIGYLPYQSAANTTLFVTGNTTTTPKFLTSTGTGTAAQAPTLTGSTGSGNVVLATSPTITGGAYTGITNLAVRDTSAAFDVTLAATSSTTLTAGRTLTLDLVNASRTLKFGGNLTLAGDLITSGANSLTFTTTGATNVTLPTTGTLATTGSLSQFASTTSVQLATVISDETGTGSLVFGTSPTISLPTINNIKMGYTTTATAASTTTLTSASNYRQFFTGATTQTIVLPVTSTLTIGTAWEIENNSTGVLTVNSSGGNLVGSIPAGACAHVVCIGTALTTAADWDLDYISFNTITGTGANVLGTSPTIAGGTHTGITSLGIRDTSAAFDVTLAATSSTTLTAGRTLTLDLVNAARTLKLGGNLTLAADFITSGANSLTLTTTGATNITLPVSGTLTTTSSNLSTFAATTSAQLAGVISDETGSGALVFGTNPVISTPFSSLTAPEMGYTINSTYVVDNNTLNTTHAGGPFSLINWHDLFAFTKLFTTTYESYNGTTWSSATLNKLPFAQQQSNGTIVAADGTATFGSRWTFTGGIAGGTAYGQGTWLVIGMGWNSGTQSTKQVKLESSTDGTTWTTRHSSQYGTTMANIFHRVGDYGGDSYLRVTVTWVSGGAVNISNIRLLTSRAGDQGWGSELMYPYAWDKDQNITTGGKLTIGSSVGVVFTGSASGTTTVAASATASGTLTLPAATDTLVGKATTDTLTNKTLSSAVLTGTLTANGSAGTAGYVLSSTGTGVQWIAQSGGGSSTVLYTSQSLTTAQQDQARSNIYAASPDDAIIYSMIF